MIFLWIIASGIWSLPPLVYVADLGEAVKSAWVTVPELEPPFGHAERVGLKTIFRFATAVALTMKTIIDVGCGPFDNFLDEVSLVVYEQVESFRVPLKWWV